MGKTTRTILCVNVQCAKHITGANAGYAGQFSLRVSGWRESPAAWLSSWSLGRSNMHSREIGWFRLAIALSLAWASIVIVATIIDFATARTDGYSLASKPPVWAEFTLASRHIFFDRYESRTFSLEQATGNEPAHDILVFHIGRFVAVWLLPVGAIWFIWFFIRWVVYGFSYHKKAA